LNWLEYVSVLLFQQEETPVKYQVRRHGSAYFVKKDVKGRITGIAPNPPYCAECFSLNYLVSYDPDSQGYYEYISSTGTWVHLLDAEIKKKVSFYFKTFADQFDEEKFRGQILTDRTNRFLEEFRRLLASFTSFGRKPKTAFIHAKNVMVPVEPKTEPFPFSPIFFSKYRIKPEYKKEAYSPRFIEFLKTSLPEEDIQLLQKWAGAVLLGRNPFHKILLAIGDADSGKTTFFNIIRNVIGEQNCEELRVSELQSRFEIGQLMDKTLLYSLDVSDKYLYQEQAHKLKGLTGGDLFKGEIKYSNETVQIKGNFNIIITCNADMTLKMQGDEAAWRRRIWMVKFTLGKFKKNVNLANVLVDEEGAGILNWMLKGARQILHHERIKKVPELTADQSKRVSNFLDAAKSLEVFVQECIRVSPGNNLITTDIIEAYENYCARREWMPLPDREAKVQLVKFMLKIHNRVRRTDIKHEGTNHRGYAKVEFVS
jgi:P4 family phage/plasmid primase-like protien